MKESQDTMTTEESMIDTIVRERVAMAPMSGVTDIPFRLMARKFGCPFAFTEMVDINGIFYRNKKSFTLLDRVPGDEPLAVQLVGDDPERFLHVAKICEDKGYKLIDINAGCPARKVVKSCKGSALMKEPEKLAEIVRKLVKNLSVPVTVKIRSGWDEDNRNYLEVSKIAVSEGAKAVCIHPRTRQQMYKGKPDRDIIKHLKESLKVPVFASGGIFKAEDAQAAVDHTGCDAVFVARGGLGRPWLFREIKDLFAGRALTPEPDFAELKEIIKEHFALSRRFYNDFRTQKRMYKYILWYLMRYKNTGEIMKMYSKIRDVSDLDGFLAKIEVDERKHLYLI